MTHSEGRRLAMPGQISKPIAVKIQKKLQAATFGAAKAGSGSKLEELLKLHDRDGEGELDAGELTRLVRKGFNIPKHELSDEEITMLVDALDDDGSKTLNIHELSDFIKRGIATFGSKPTVGLTATEERRMKMNPKCVRRAPRQPTWRDFEEVDDDDDPAPVVPVPAGVDDYSALTSPELLASSRPSTSPALRRELSPSRHAARTLLRSAGGRRPSVFDTTDDAFTSQSRNSKTLAAASSAALPSHLICANSGYRTFSFAPEQRREVVVRDSWQYTSRVR